MTFPDPRDRRDIDDDRETEAMFSERSMVAEQCAIDEWLEEYPWRAGEVPA